MDETTVITIILVQAVICAILCAAVAESKKRDASAWAVVGLITGIFGLIAIAGMPPITSENEVEQARETSEEGEERLADCICPYCHTELELDEVEKETGEFDCPECGKHVKING